MSVVELLDPDQRMTDSQAYVQKVSFRGWYRIQSHSHKRRTMFILLLYRQEIPEYRGIAELLCAQC